MVDIPDMMRCVFKFVDEADEKAIFLSLSSSS